MGLQARIKIARTPHYLEIPETNILESDIILGLLFCERPITQQWAESIRNVQANGARLGVIAIQSDSFQTSLGQISKYNPNKIAPARNTVVSKAIKSQARYVLFLDDDVEFPVGALDKMLSAMCQYPHAWVCGGTYQKRDRLRGDLRALLWDGKNNFIESWPAKPFQCGAVGGGCMLVSMDAFLSMPAPWFIGDSNGNDDDIIFCRKVREQGHQVIAHGDIQCKHWDVIRNECSTIR